MKLITRIANAAKAAKRSFDIGGPTDDHKHRWPAWASSYAPAREALAARHPLAAKSSYLIANSPTGASISDQWATNLVMDGPAIQSTHPDESMRHALDDGFREWCQNVSVADDGTSLAAMLQQIVRSTVSSGEAVAHMMTTPRAELRLKLLNPEQLDPARTRELENLDRIISGVHFNAAGRIIGYHIFPNQMDLFVNMAWAPLFVPAEDVLHVFEAKLPGQVRGVSWLAPVATTILQIDQLQDALLARANTAALFGAFVTDPSGTSGFTDGARDPAQLSLEPGVMRILPPDCTVSFPTMPDTASAPDLLRHLMRTVAAGVGLTYEVLSGDFSTSTYSSTKAGIEGFKRRCIALREMLLIAKVLSPVYRRWVTLEILSGRLSARSFDRDPSPYFGAKFIFPTWASLEPLKEAQADAVLINAGVASRSQVIAARGRDIDDVDQEIARDTFVPRMPAVPGAEGVPTDATA